MADFRLEVDDKSLGKVLDEQMDEIIDFVFQKSQENIVSLGVTDRGTLLKSGQIIRKFLDKRVVYTVPYADSIEFGRIPGIHPPVEPIVGWVRRKLGIKDEKKARSIAWAIATDLKKNGTQEKPYMRPAIKAAEIKYG